MKLTIWVVAAAAALAVPAVPSAASVIANAQQTYEVGRCIAERDRPTAVALLGSLPISGGAVEFSRLPPVTAERCAQGLDSAPTLQLRGALAQALFFRDFGNFGNRPRRSATLVNLGLPVESSPPGDEQVELYRWADCIVRNDSVRAERLLVSGVGSRAEETAIMGLRNYMAACAPASMDATVRPSELRSLLAQSAYHSMYRYWAGELGVVHR